MGGGGRGGGMLTDGVICLTNVYYRRGYKMKGIIGTFIPLVY